MVSTTFLKGRAQQGQSSWSGQKTPLHAPNTFGKHIHSQRKLAATTFLLSRMTPCRVTATWGILTGHSEITASSFSATHTPKEKGEFHQL